MAGSVRTFVPAAPSSIISSEIVHGLDGNFIAKCLGQPRNEFALVNEPVHRPIFVQYRIGQSQGRVADIAAANIATMRPIGQPGCIRTVLFERLRDFVTFFAGRLTADVVGDNWRTDGRLIGPH